MKTSATHFWMTGSRILFGSLLLLCSALGQFTFPDKENPHGSDNCLACHFQEGPAGKANFNPASCDGCHSRSAVNSKIHPLNQLDMKAKGINIPKEFAVSSSGEFDCTTCHAVVCKPDRANQTFLRGGPFKTELDFCFSCHEKDSYQQLNPHLQIQVDGSVDESTCLHCHLEVPDLETRSMKNHFMHLDMTPTCNKCHALHRHENQHLGRIIADAGQNIRNAMGKTEKKFNIKFPLSEAGEIQCNTCHYTHQRGLIQKEEVVFEGSQENLWRLRLAREQLCFACHDL